ncbi:hypothetical protein V6N12_019977 [Hibiscus sabdariffa]|uniref:Uncharacterized protein n=1 Tax=Hibiscus sabdariffa TaxID=183260 RepID=A0ABR2BGK6_9ROSI
MNLTKFALDSAINVSLKGFTGGQKLYQTIVQEKLIDERKGLKLEDAKEINFHSISLVKYHERLKDD